MELIGWILAAIFVGLWWGELGRRRDLAMLVDMETKRDVAVSVVTDPEVQAAERAASFDIERLTAHLLEAKPGLSAKDAKAEAERMVNAVHSAGSTW